MIKKRMIFLAFSLFIPTMTFQSCGNQFVLRQPAESEIILQPKSCDAEIFEIFISGFHPFLKTNCGTCHYDGGRGVGRFADRNISIAWEDFRSMSAEAISRNAINDEHRPPQTGKQHRPVITDLLTRWTKAMQTKQECEIALQLSKNPMNAPFITTEKEFKENELPTSEVRLTWNLAQDLKNEKQIGLIPANLSINFGVTVRNDKIQLNIRQPTIQLQSADALKTKNLWIHINGKKVPEITRYLTETDVIGTQEVSLFNQNNSSVIYELPYQSAFVNQSLKISLEIERIEQLPITYEMLVGTNTTFNVFARRCVSCHGNTRQDGGLNLLNQDRAQLLAQTILFRMRSRNRPMPPAGLLPDSEIYLVQRWVNGLKSK